MESRKSPIKLSLPTPKSPKVSGVEAFMVWAPRNLHPAYPKPRHSSVWSAIRCDPRGFGRQTCDLAIESRDEGRLTPLLHGTGLGFTVSG